MIGEIKGIYLFCLLCLLVTIGLSVDYSSIYRFKYNLERAEVLAKLLDNGSYQRRPLDRAAADTFFDLDLFPLDDLDTTGLRDN